MEKTELKKNITIGVPKIHETSFVAPGAQIIGNITLKSHSSVWYNTVLRGDINEIVIGNRSNIQDNSVVHLENDQGVIVGNDVTVGHNVILHGCTIEDGSLIGMGAIVMNGVNIGRGTVIGAGTVLKENMTVPNYSLVVGIPGKIIRTLEKEIYLQNIKWAKKYTELAKIHKKQIIS